MERKIIISADSTCDLSPELVEKYGIAINPQPITLGDESRIDGVTINPEEIFEFAKRTGTLAKTSAQNSSEFAEYFKKLTASGKQVVHFSISSSMSGTYNFARLAAEDVGNVFVVDSQNLSTGIGLLVLKAAELADEGKDAQQVYDEICELRSRVDASFVIDTLEFLHKGGRCSTIAMLGANVLKLKPCIEVTNGAMAVAKKYRGKIVDVFKEYAKNRLENADDIDTSRVFVTHSCPDDTIANEIRDIVFETLHFDDMLVTKAGCTVSAHCGPYTLGVLFIRKTPKQ